MRSQQFMLEPFPTELCMRKRHHVTKASLPFGCFSPQGKANKSNVFLVRAMKSCSGRRSVALLVLNTLRTGDADLRFYITTVQDG